ncbi:MAG: PEPxxWA-CTERM sorting domain-containing protein [Thermaurantiacus tibetensis]|uniref:PEPxxWA-CTERM sorting domain-containing protein n=1 Tax=Thermaurantiacus tibetensis TaxID=2759035 RepID=UPI00188E3502|nr:PEPxxWA-CTERM sorting domain-containing protein [Thermaurantiacus tibetensis]
MKKLLLAAAGAALVAAPATAAVTVLTFEGIGNLNPVGAFYAPDYIFSPATLAIVDADAGGSGNFANEPSPNTIMFFLDANNAILDVPAGFTTGFSFWYTSSVAASVTVYDGPGATGNVLATLNLVAQAFGCPGDPTGAFACWSPVGVTFSGTAFSIDFGGTANQTGFDNITFGSANPRVPEPGVWAMLIAGFGLVGHAARRRRTALAA